MPLNYDHKIAVAVGERRPFRKAIPNTRIHNKTANTGNIITPAGSIQLVNDSSLNG